MLIPSSPSDLRASCWSSLSAACMFHIAGSPGLPSERSPLICCRALVANSFWEAESESLSKQTLRLDGSQHTEIPVWLCALKLQVENAARKETGEMLL